MGADRFAQNLKCPGCGKEGIADLEQEEGWSFVKGNHYTTVAHMPDGFREVRGSGKDEFDIICTVCNVSAVAPPVKF